MAILGGVLHLIPNLLTSIGGVLGIFSGMLTTTGQAGAPASISGLIQTGLSLIGVLASLLLIIAGIGVLQLRSWAWPLALLVTCAAILGTAARLVETLSHGRRESPLGQFIALFGQGSAAASEGAALVLCAAVLVYLFTPTVRAAFGVTGHSIRPHEAPRAHGEQEARG